MRDGLIVVYQAAGDVVVIRGDDVQFEPYGVFPTYFDQLARDSLTEIEREADRLRRGQA